MFIGFGGGLIGPGTPVVQFIFPNTTGAWLTLIGLLITVILYVRKVPGALIISILLTAAIGLIIGFTEFPDSFTATPSFATLGDFDLGNVFSTLGSSPQR